MSALNPDLSQPTCRVCLQNNQDEEMSSIFDLDADFNDLHIYEKIEQCAGIKIIRHEKIPTLICSDCYGILKVSYKFRTICRNSNEYLKEFVFSGKASPKIEESSPKVNPLLIADKIPGRKSKRSNNKTNVKEKATALPQTIKKEDITETIKCENDEAANSPTNSEDQHDDFDDEMWFDPNYQEEDDLDISMDSIDVVIKEEILEESDKTKKSNKRKKKTTAKTKKPRTKPSKTLDISFDGAAIIREKKPRAKREKKEKQPQICDVCGNIYQRRYALELHMRRHRDEKPYECELCSYAFHSNFELIRHMRTHTGSRPYKCSYCPRAFGDQSTLIKHERIHRNERPFKCDTCGKSFTYSNVLKSHILTHTGEKPYSCELCGKCFTRSHHLRAHLETLQHQSDPRSKILLQNIKKNNEGETVKTIILKL